MARNISESRRKSIARAAGAENRAENLPAKNKSRCPSLPGPEGQAGREEVCGVDPEGGGGDPEGGDGAEPPCAGADDPR